MYRDHDFILPIHQSTPRRTLALLVAMLAALGNLTAAVAWAQNAASAVTNVWEPIGPQIATIFSMARDPEINEIVYAGAHFGGLHRSVDSGRTWTHIPTDFSNDIVYAIEILDTTPRTLFVATQDGGIYKSIDDGVTWLQKNTGLTSTTLRDIKADPFNNQVLITGSFEGVFRSADGGETWSPVQTTEPFFPGIHFAWDPAQPGVVYAATQGLGVFRSTDDGERWAPFTQGVGERIMTSIVWDVTNPDRLFATSPNGVFVLDRGATIWRDLKRDLPNGARVAHATTVPNDGRLFAATDHGVFTLPIESLDADYSINPLDTPDIIQEQPPGWSLWYAVESRFVESDRTGAILHIAFTVQQFEYTTDDGQTFNDATLGIQNAFCGALATTQFEDYSVLYVGTGKNIRATAGNPFPTNTVSCAGDANGDGVRDSADLALTLSHWGAPGPAGALGDTNHDGVRNADDLIATLNHWQSPCETTSAPVPQNASTVLQWQNQIQTNGAIFELTPDPSDPSVLYAGEEGDGVLKGTNFGNNWATSSNGLVPPDVIAVDQSVDDFDIYYAATSAGIYVSDDGGHTWQGRFQQQNPTRLTALDADPLFDGWVYYANDLGQVFRSTDKGVIFIPLWQAPPGEALTQLKATPFFSIYAVGSSGAFYTSPDQGENFFTISDSNLLHPALCVDAVDDAPQAVYVGTNGGGVYRSQAAGQFFEQRNTGIDIPFIFSIAIDQSSPTTLYAGSIGTVYKTADEGQQWTAHTTGLPSDGFVRQLVIDPNDANRVYAGVVDRPQEFASVPAIAGVYRSVDAGLTWSRISNDPDFQFVGGLYVSRDEPSVVFAGSKFQGLYRTTGADVQWTPSSDAMSLIVLSIAIDPTDTNILYASTVTSGVFKSTDVGATWRHIGLEDEVVFHIAVDSTNPSILYASTGRGPMRSTDAGETWALAGQDNPFVTTIASDPRDRSTLYMGGFDGAFYRSDDAGRTWIRAVSGLPSANINAIAVDPRDGTIYVGVDSIGVYHSSDGGDHWWGGDNTPFAGKSIVSLAVDPASGELYVGQLGELYKSDDRGDSFQLLNTGITNDFPSAIAIVPTTASLSSHKSIPESQSVVTVTLRNEQGPDADAPRPVIVSTDAGLTWSSAKTGLPEPDARFIAVAGQGAEASLFLATDAGVFVSTDLGTSWRPTASAPPMPINRMIARHTTPVTLFATTDDGLYRSIDAGDSWTLLQLPADPPAPVAFRLAPGPDNGLYVGTTARGVYYSDDAGDTFSGGVTQEIAVMVPHAIAIDPFDHNTLVAGTAFFGIAVSNDAGVNWRLSNQGLGATKIFAVEFDPLDTNLLYATSQDAGVWFSEDRGATWSPLNEGLYNEFVTSFAIDPIDHTVLYAGTEGGGVFRLRRP